MRLTLPAAWACAILVASIGTASAGMISTTPAPATTTSVLRVTDTEMTVANPYGYANLRAKPSTSAKVLQKLTKGTKVTVVEKVDNGTWSHVKVGTTDGYVLSKLLK
jgi:uncharacterized protein YgiM (DUF1202 family)